MFTIDEIIKAASARPLQRGSCRSVSSVAIDSRTAARGCVFIAIKGARCDGHAFVGEALSKGAACLIVEKGSRFRAAPVSVWVLEVSDTTRALGDLARFHRSRFRVPVIAVTGSNGKTTTKEILATLLEGSYTVLKTEGTKNNHIGLPLTLLKMRAGYQAVVLELGTNHFGEMAYLGGICRPDIAVITSIGPSHLQFFRTIEGVRREKFSLLKFLQGPGIAVVNADDPGLRGSPAGFTVTYGFRHPADFSAQVIESTAAGLRFRAHGRTLMLPVLGEHNLSNFLAALACARMLGVSYGQLGRRLASIRMPAGRLQPRRIRRVTFIDDTYNANPASMDQALRCLQRLPVSGRRIVVMGDMLELGGQAGRFHRQAGRQAAHFCDVLIAVGRQARAAAQAARSRGLSKTEVFSCRDCRQAEKVLRDVLRVTGADTVLVKGSRGMHLEEIFDLFSRK